MYSLWPSQRQWPSTVTLLTFNRFLLVAAHPVVVEKQVAMAAIVALANIGTPDDARNGGTIAIPQVVAAVPGDLPQMTLL